MIPAIGYSHRTMSDASAAVTFAQLWRRYREGGDVTARTQLIARYSPLVKLVARRALRQLPANLEEGDLVSYGFFGLISAMERFDPSRGVKFETFASARIRGAMLDELRSLDWIPRSVRRQASEIRRTTERLERRLRRAPTLAETAAALDLPVDRLRRTLHDIANASVLTLDDLRARAVPPDSTALIETIDDPEGVDPMRELVGNELRDHVAHAVTRLPERERLVIGLYYYDDLTLREIGALLGVAKSRASQLRASAITRLRALMHEDLQPVTPLTS
jgi:RNA polymerase sigma factor for flagellar operon FliA